MGCQPWGVAPHKTVSVLVLSMGPVVAAAATPGARGPKQAQVHRAGGEVEPAKSASNVGPGAGCKRVEGAKICCRVAQLALPGGRCQVGFFGIRALCSRVPTGVS